MADIATDPDTGAVYVQFWVEGRRFMGRVDVDGERAFLADVPLPPMELPPPPGAAADAAEPDDGPPPLVARIGNPRRGLTRETCR